MTPSPVNMEIQSITGIPLKYELDEGTAIGSGRHVPITSRELTLIRVETNDGRVGWGEGHGFPCTNVSLLNEAIADRIVGMHPFEVVHSYDQLYADYYHYGAQGPIQQVLSGINIAAWDILGKALNEPIHRLLGGPTRTEVTPYATLLMEYDPGTGEVEEDSASQIQAAVDKGFEAVKIKIGRGIDDDLHRVEVARDILGEDRYLMVDYNGTYRTDQAIRSARAIEPYGIEFIEEPILPYYPSEYERIRNKTTIPVAAGEALDSRFGFKQLLDAGGIDIVQPDVSKCGGISEMVFLAKLAQMRNLGISPHHWSGPLTLAATLHAVAGITLLPSSAREPEPFFIEFDQSENALRNALIQEPFSLSGSAIEIPSGPGLGVTIDEEAVDEYRVRGEI